MAAVVGLLDGSRIPVGLGKLEWSCHVCGCVRPDAEMGVISRARRLLPQGALAGEDHLGIEMQENLRYCLVAASCVKAAEEWRDRAPLASSWRDGLPGAP